MTLPVTLCIVATFGMPEVSKVKYRYPVDDVLSDSLAYVLESVPS